MAKQSTSTAVPKLRFPEFRKTAGWKETSLSSVLVEHGAKNDGASEVHSVSVRKGVVNQIEHLGRSFAAADRSNYSLAKPHDIIYTRSPTGEFPYGIVKQSRLPINVIVSPLYGVFSPVSRYLGYMLDAYFESPIRTNNYLAPIIQKGAKNTVQISNAVFLSKALYLASEEGEQRKIAECLTSLDEVIAAQERKGEALKAHKRGLIQELFPREGESRPRVRFPEFRNAPEWSEERLGNLVDIRSGNSPSHYQLSKTGAYPFVKVEDLNNCIKYQSEAREYSDDTDGVIPLRSLIFPKRGAAIELNKIRLNEREILMDTNMMALTTNGGLQAEFLFYCISHVGLSQVADSSTIPQINNKHIIPFKVVVPLPDEQKRIADCLSALDTLFAAESNQLAALKTHKQGLMQQLFPVQETTDA